MFLRLRRRVPVLLEALVFAWIALSSPALFGAAAAPSSDELTGQRERFPLVWEAALHGPGDAWRKLAPGLENYPLYPYLVLAEMQRNLAQLKPAQVQEFLGAWPDSVPAQTLRDAFLAELAKRQDWKNYLALFAGASHAKELQCDALQARLAQGQTPDFKQDIQPLWLSTSILPPACDAALAWATQHGKLDSAMIWQRIDLAAAAANADLVSALAPLLSGEERSGAERVALSLRDPAGALNQAVAWPDTTYSRRALVAALQRLARHDSDGAETQWAKLSPQFHFDTEQRDLVLHALALYRATNYAPDALARLVALPATAEDDATHEWQVRVAVAAADWKAALSALDGMLPAQKSDARWRYLHARVLVKLGRSGEATAIFDSVSQEANFHGFLAADWLRQPYTICSAQAEPGGAQNSGVDIPGLKRAFEFFTIGRLREARREWDYTLAQLDPQQRRQAAASATRLGWYDRAVYTLNQGEDVHLYDLRFPLPRREQIERDAKSAGIDPAWAYAIIRAESAWTTDARSGADAWGLMQLLPGTARELAKVEKLSFSGAADLFDADLNIRLGTRYLSNMALRYDGSPWLATAAYNAGSDPVERWINARDSLEPDFFIETIPYKETREYVARVLAFSVIYDWRLNGSVHSLASRLPRIGQAYALPGADAERKSVVCPAQAKVAAATIQ
jgi:soluble lytic murein transglycosylase